MKDNLTHCFIDEFGLNTHRTEFRVFNPFLPYAVDRGVLYVTGQVGEWVSG